MAQENSCPISVTAITGTGNVASGTALVKGDTISTGIDSFLELTLGEGAKLKLGPESILYIDVAYCPNPSNQAVRLKLLSGTLWAKGHASMPKFEISTAHFLATLGTTTLAARARYIDSSFTMEKESQKIETRDWQDTVNVLSHTFPFKGEIAQLFGLQGNIIMIPWGKRGALLKPDQQVTYGYYDYHISNKPVPIASDELPFDVDGNYLLGS